MSTSKAKAGAKAKKARAAASTTSQKTYLRRVFLQLNSDKRMSGPALLAVDQLVQKKLDSLTKSAVYIGQQYKLHTISDREVQAAVRAGFDGAYGERLDKAGIEAMGSYRRNTAARKKGEKAKSSAGRAGLALSVARVSHSMRGLMPSYSQEKKGGKTAEAKTRVGALAGVYVAGALEQFAKDVFSAAIKAVQEAEKVKITTKYLFGGLVSERELFVAAAGYVFDNRDEVKDEVKAVLVKALTPKKKKASSKKKESGKKKSNKPSKKSGKSKKAKPSTQTA